LTTPVTIRAHIHDVAGSAVPHRIMSKVGDSWPYDCVMIQPEVGEVMFYVQNKYTVPAAVVITYDTLDMLSQYLNHLKVWTDSVQIIILLAAIPHVAIIPFNGDMSIREAKSARLSIERGIIQATLAYARHCLVANQPGSVVWKLNVVAGATIVEPLIGGTNLIFANQKLPDLRIGSLSRVVRPCFANYNSLYHVGAYYQVLPCGTVVPAALNLSEKRGDIPRGFSHVSLDTIEHRTSKLPLCEHGLNPRKCGACNAAGTRPTKYQAGLLLEGDKNYPKILKDHIASWYAVCRFAAINNNNPLL